MASTMNAKNEVISFESLKTICRDTVPFPRMEGLTKNKTQLAKSRGRNFYYFYEKQRDRFAAKLSMLACVIKVKLLIGVLTCKYFLLWAVVVVKWSACSSSTLTI